MIELLLVVTLLAMVSMAMYGVLNNGLRIWQKITRQLPQEDAVIFLDKFSRDLRNGVNSASINFSGREEELSLPTLVKSTRLQNTTVGQVTYSYDPQAELLTRQQDDYSQVYSGSSQGSLTQSLTNIKSLKFQYYVFKEDDGIYFWQDTWQKSGMPPAVKVELEIGDGDQTRKFIQSVFIPIAG